MRNFLDRAKQKVLSASLKSATKRAIQKTAEATGDLIGNKVADKNTRISKISPQNNSERDEEEILKQRYISPK